MHVLTSVIRRTLALVAGALLAMATVAAIAADAPGRAAGTFRSQAIMMPVNSAMAFRGKSAFDKSDVIVIAVTNADMRVDWLAAFVDRRRAIEQRVKGNDIVVVFFEFKLDGAYRGLSYYFKAGNGCGNCGGGVMSSVRMANGRLAGSLKASEGTREMDIALNVPLTSDDHGAALPPDGGAPGKAYLGYHDALVKRDAKAMREFLTDETRKALAESERTGKLAADFEALARDHPTKAVQITKGFGNDKRAVLLIAGESGALRLVGEVTLVNEGGTWRVDDELTDVATQ